MVMSIGLGGAVLYHLLTHCYEKFHFAYTDNLENTVHISSQYRESDVLEFERVLSSVQDGVVYGLDLRTKTGALGKMLRDMIREWENKTHNKADFSYTVIFDPNRHADLRAFEEELKDEERPYWGIGDMKELFRQENGLWRYNISHELIKNLPNVQEIKRLF